MERARTEQLQSETSHIIRSLVANPVEDIKAERRKASFKPEELSAILHGDAKKAEKKRKLIETLASDPDFNKEQRYFMNQQEAYHYSVKLFTKLQDKVMELGISKPDDIEVLRKAIGFPSPTDLHFGMFLPTILGQGTQDQLNELLPKSIRFEIFGTYAQTELGHGTFLRGLETTATFDQEKQEFIIHSPTVTATKWWPGGLAKTANYVVLMARLFIKGKDFGPHAFLFPIRDLNTHQPLPGIEVGDIGPKLGFNTVDNGFLRFDHFRVPASALMSKNAQVTPDGKYIPKSGTAKAAYGTMIFVRSIIVFGASYNLMKAVTISTRYSAVRRQTSEREGEMEKQILDYQNQQYQLFTQIATSWALHFTGVYMRGLYSEFQKGSKSGDLGALPEVHATSSGLKSLVTTLTSEGIESCRKACGGHGYSHFSGLPLLYEDYVAACTYEGENTIMHLQTARYLMKEARKSLGGEKPTGNCIYLEGASQTVKQGCQAKSSADFLNSEILIECFKRRATHTIMETLHSLDSRTQQTSANEAWNSTIIDLVRCSQAHCYYILVNNFIQGVNQLPASPSKQVLKKLSDLFALYSIEKNLGDFTEFGYFSTSQVRDLRDCSRNLLRELRPEAVTLVDSFDLHDYELASALGRYDGDVYNTMVAWAKKAPLNKSDITPAYYEFLQKKMKANL